MYKTVFRTNAAAAWLQLEGRGSGVASVSTGIFFVGNEGTEAEKLTQIQEGRN